MVKAKKAEIQKVEEDATPVVAPQTIEDTKAKEPAKTKVEAPKTKFKIIDY
jgi:hypothetical protein